MLRKREILIVISPALLIWGYIHILGRSSYGERKEWVDRDSTTLVTFISHILRFLLYDWLKCSHMTKDILPIMSSDLLSVDLLR